MLYTGTLMTENAFYPLFLVVALLLVLTLERPTPARQLSLLVLCGIAFETRAQAVALVAAAATAPLLLALDRAAAGCGARCGASRRSTASSPRPSSLVAARDRGARRVAPVAARRLPRRDVEQLHGRRRPALPALPRRRARPLPRRRPVRGAARDLARAPRAVAGGARVRGGLARARRPGSCSRWRRSPRSSFVARIEERNMFYVAPLALVALLGLAADGVVPRRPARRPGRRGRRRRAARSSSRSRASSRRARSRTPSRCCPGGGCRITGSRSRHVRSRRSPSALAAAALFAVPAAPVRARPAGARRAYFVRDDASSSRTAATGSTGRRVGSLFAGIAPGASGLDRPRRRPGRLGRRPLDGNDDRRTRSGRTSSSTAASARVYDLAGAGAPTRCPRRRSTRRADGVLVATRPDGRTVRPVAVRARRRLGSTSPGTVVAPRSGRRRPLPRRRPARPAHARARPLPERHLVGHDASPTTRFDCTGGRLAVDARERPGALRPAPDRDRARSADASSAARSIPPARRRRTLTVPLAARAGRRTSAPSTSRSAARASRRRSIRRRRPIDRVRSAPTSSASPTTA